MTWDKKTLTKLYAEGNTLQAIGNYYGVSRERVRQVMQRMGIPRARYGRAYRKVYSNGTRFATLDEYLQHSAVNNKSHNFDCRTIRKYLPENVHCAECARYISKQDTHVHHITYPATTATDIQLLCPSCHKTKHTKGLSFVQQISVYNEYMNGSSLADLSRVYGQSVSNISAIVLKIGNGAASLREAKSKNIHRKLSDIRRTRPD